jgi:hypothetical protein
MMRDHPAAHLVAGLLPIEDAAGTLAKIRGLLLARLAEAVGANGTGCYSRWASRRSFLFDDATAKAIERALSRHMPAEALPQDGKPLAFP